MPEGDLYSHRGTRAIQRMVEFAPSTGGLALWVRHVDLPEQAPAIATDGNAVFYGQHFERLPLGEQTAWVAHEILHIALRHPQRLAELRRVVGDVDLQLFNICADAIVNSTISHLTWLTLPSSSVFLDKLVAVALSEKQSVETALLHWDVEVQARARRTAAPVPPKSLNRARTHSAGRLAMMARGPRGSARSAAMRLWTSSAALIRGVRPRPRPNRPALGASGCCAATPATACIPCCVP
jgi:hypothetical protein